MQQKEVSDWFRIVFMRKAFFNDSQLWDWVNFWSLDYLNQITALPCCVPWSLGRSERSERRSRLQGIHLSPRLPWYTHYPTEKRVGEGCPSAKRWRGAAGALFKFYYASFIYTCHSIRVGPNQIVRNTDSDTVTVLGCLSVHVNKQTSAAVQCCTVTVSLSVLRTIWLVPTRIEWHVYVMIFV